MSLKAIKDAVNELEAVLDHPNAPASVRETWEKAKAEISALERAAKDLTRLSAGTEVYDVRGRGHLIYVSRWSHPDAKAWDESLALSATIAKEAE